MVDVKKIGVIAGCAFVFILLSASTGGVGWITTEAFGVESSGGLFRTCRKAGGASICADIASDLLSDKDKAVQAFMILSVLTAIAAVVFAILHMVTDKIPVKLISLLMVVIFVLALIGLAIFTANKEDLVPSADYGWAYGLGWFGALAALIVGVLVFVLFRSS